MGPIMTAQCGQFYSDNMNKKCSGLWGFWLGYLPNLVEEQDERFVEGWSPPFVTELGYQTFISLIQIDDNN